MNEFHIVDYCTTNDYNDIKYIFLYSIAKEEELDVHDFYFMPTEREYQLALDISGCLDSPLP